MAEKPRTAAEIAEQQGLLSNELLDSASIVETRAQIENLRADIYKINNRLAWIVSAVRSTYHTTNPTDLNIDQEQVNLIKTVLDDLHGKTLYVGDILNGNYTED